MSTLLPVLRPPGQSETLFAFGEEVRLLLTGKDTGGKYVQWEEITPPGGGPPPHYHKNEDEFFYVLEGRMSFFANDTWTELGAGGSIFLPRYSVHTFKNVGDTPARMLITTSPAGFDDFYRESAALFTEVSPPDLTAVIALAESYGIHFV